MAAGAGRTTPDDQQPSHIVALARQTLVYGVSGIGLQAVGVVTLPVFARIFTQAQYGAFELATVLLSVALSIVDAGLGSAAQRSFFDYTETQAERRRSVIATALAATGLLGVVVAIVLMAVRGQVAHWIFGREAGSLVLAVAISIPLVNVANFLRETMRLRFRAWHYVVSSLIATVVTAGLGIAAATALDLDVRGVFVGVIVGNAIAMAYGALVVRHDIGRHLSWPELKTMLRYGLPLVPAAVALWALALVDRIMLSRLGSLTEVGQYAVANRIASVLLLLVTAFSLAFGPYILSIYSEDRALERIVRVQTLRYVAVVLSTGALLLTLFARELLDIVAPAFDAANRVVGLLTFSVVAFGLSTVLVAGISFARRTGFLALVAGAAAVTNIALNFALIPPFGIVGAAVANAAAYLLLAGLHYVVAQRLYPTAYELGKVSAIVGLAYGFSLLGLIAFEPLAVSLVVKATAAAAFLVLLRATRLVLPTELERLRTLVVGIWRLRLSAT